MSNTEPQALDRSAFSETAIRLFHSKVKVDAVTECWPWLGMPSPKGYGTFKLHKAYRAHRVALCLTGVSIPKGMQVCHRCDNPICCNPAHLFVGTNQDNRNDCVQKGRQQHGERHCCAKLTVEDVRFIRQPVKNGKGTTALGRIYNVNEATIRDVVTQKTWKGVL